jgi:glyoxylase-like metal-dependent hydrolase (beta-lactamase superfamily II)
MVEATLTLRTAGSCSQLERSISTRGRLRSIEFPAGCATFVHPREGVVLVDTGYSGHFFEASRRFPYRFYRWATPVSWQPDQAIRAQLEREGIGHTDVRTILLTHLHADHCAGLRDFPHARIVTAAAGAAYYLPRRGLAAARTGFLPALIPPDFSNRLTPIESTPLAALDARVRPYTHGRDVFGDGAVFAVPLPGHARGQYGFLIGNTFLCADAAWTYRSILGQWQLPAIARLITDDAPVFAEQLAALKTLIDAGITVVPSHDMTRGA